MNTQTSLNHLNYEYSKPVKTTSTTSTQTSLNQPCYDTQQSLNSTINTQTSLTNIINKVHFC